MLDFTITKFIEFIDVFLENDYTFEKVHCYCEIVKVKTQKKCSNSSSNFEFEEGFGNQKIIILRHDVDANPQNSLRFAQIQTSKGIFGTYYFRAVPKSYNEHIIREIHGLGHEIGYHYETMDTCGGDVVKAYDEFLFNLEKFRKIVPIQTICMHGSPLSKFDNRTIWKKFNYRNLDISCEPYIDINFNEVFYLTDTGRCWDGNRFNFRDKATKENPVSNSEFLELRFHTTKDIIKAVNQKSFPQHSMLTFHPQRWNSKILPWTKELGFQSLKNTIKYLIIKTRH